METLSLNQDEVLFTVTRRLTGSCYQPTESITVSEPVVLTAGLEPEHPFYEQVSWKGIRSDGKNLLLEPIRGGTGKTAGLPRCGIRRDRPIRPGSRI
ncbi:MAG: hypothetical protein ACLUD2_07605 [Clostridium sp.]